MINKLTISEFENKLLSRLEYFVRTNTQTSIQYSTPTKGQKGTDNHIQTSVNYSYIEETSVTKPNVQINNNTMSTNINQFQNIINKEELKENQVIWDKLDKYTDMKYIKGKQIDENGNTPDENNLLFEDFSLNNLEDHIEHNNANRKGKMSNSIRNEKDLEFGGHLTCCNIY